ncbi:uncharacterized protein LOC144702426 isoform X2 [Wolffia australiana]
MGDLGIQVSNGWTIMSDQQKGLENAVAYLLPHAEHRNCARHVYANWKKKGHSTGTLRMLFWNAVKCTTHQDFQRIMQQMTTLKPQAAQDFRNIGVKKFCMAYISETPKCEVIDNNVCECFNSYILQYRSEPTIDILEDIRSTIMQRIVKKREVASDTIDQLCPRIRKLVEGNKLKFRTCSLRHAGEFQFEVTDFGNRFVVDIRSRSCSCRYWNIRGIPCSHAITCIHWMKQDPVSFVTDWLKKDVYKRAYRNGIRPLNGRSLWTEVEGNYLFPPIVKK